jgi:hypothetical protein
MLGLACLDFDRMADFSDIDGMCAQLPDQIFDLSTRNGPKMAVRVVSSGASHGCACHHDFSPVAIDRRSSRQWACTGVHTLWIKLFPGSAKLN